MAMTKEEDKVLNVTKRFILELMKKDRELKLVNSKRYAERGEEELQHLEVSITFKQRQLTAFNDEQAKFSAGLAHRQFCLGPFSIRNQLEQSFGSGETAQQDAVTTEEPLLYPRGLSDAKDKDLREAGC